MPFVPPADALNARVTKVPSGALEHEGLYRVPLVASDAMRLILLEMPAGYRTIPHRHPGAGELFYILSGSATFTIGDAEPIAAAAGDLLFARVDEVHTIEAGSSGLRFLAGVGPNEDRPDEEVLVPDA